MDFYGKFLKTNITLYHTFMRTGLINCIKTLQRNQFLSLDEISKLQLKKTRALLKYAYKNIKYYNELFKKIKFDPDINKIEDLKKIPILTKEIIRKNKEKLINRDYDPKYMRENYTGGSSGKPLRFYQNAEYNLYNTADKIRHFNMCGYRFGEKKVFLWGAYRDKKKIIETPTLKEKIMREIWINTFNLSSKDLENGTSFLKIYNPKLVISYVSSAELFAKYVQNSGIDLKLQAIECSAEKIHKNQRKLISDTFNCEVFDRYGCREVGNIAHECSEHHGLHISSDLHVVEIIDENNNNVLNEPGKVIITNLTNYTMPFIRYDVEDAAILQDEPCNCKRGFPLLKEITGRASTNFIFPSGKTMFGAYFQEKMASLPGIKQFQISQETKELLNIYLVINRNFDENKFEETKNQIINYIDEDIIIEKKIVDNIKRSPTGKYHAYFSKVK